MASTQSKTRKRSDKFPLTLHPTGQYCKKIHVIAGANPCGLRSFGPDVIVIRSFIPHTEIVVCRQISSDRYLDT